MEIVVLVALAILIAVLLAFSFAFRGEKRAPTRGERREGTGVTTRTCPLCGSSLARGERVRSVFYPSPGDTLAEIHGCRYCEGSEAAVPRICPVCKEPVPADGYVIARVFKRPEKTHIHVLGCTRCRPARGGKPRQEGLPPER